MFAVFGLPKKPQPDAQSEGVVSIAFGVSSAVDIVRLMVLRSGREGQTFGCAEDQVLPESVSARRVRAVL